MRALLEIKKRSLVNGGDGLIGYQDTQARGIDRFVVRDWEKVSQITKWFNYQFELILFNI